MFNNVNDVKYSHLCYGCGTCNAICNTNAITMKYDAIGLLQPVINESICTQCGLCVKICPSVDSKNIQLPKIDDYYVGNYINTLIGKSNDEIIFKNAQSGGMVTAVLKKLFDTKEIDAAIVCKVEFADSYLAKVVVIDSISDLYDCQKSSYIPIDICSAVLLTEKYKSIAVVGTGCHIQGIKALKNLKQKYRDKIKYSLGLICDRTLCKTVTDVLYGDYLKNISKKIVWRDKSLNYKNAKLIIKTEDGKIRELPRWQRFVLKDPFTNPRCRICFDKLNVNADIVFGDPWGMNNIDWQNGESVIITRTQIGDELISKMIADGDVYVQKTAMSEIIAGQLIEKRKLQVSSALKFYKRMNWQIPNYAEKLIKESDEFSSDKKILEFISDSKRSKNDIVKKYRWFLKKICVENYVKAIITHCLKIFQK